MLRQYFDNSYDALRHHATVQPQQTRDSSFRRNMTSATRDLPFQSTFQPSRARNLPLSSRSSHQRERYPYFDENPSSTRSSSHQTNNASNDRVHRRYRLEAPSGHTSERQRTTSYKNDFSTHFRPSDRSLSSSQQSSASRPSTTQSHRYDQGYPRYERNSDQTNRRHHREETYSSPTNQGNLNRRSVPHPSSHHNSIPARSSHHPSPPSRTVPNSTSLHNQISLFPQTFTPFQFQDPNLLLTDILQNFFGRHTLSFDDDDDDDDNEDLNLSSLSPIDMLAFAWMMRRPNIIGAPTAFHIQFGDLFDLLAQDESPSVGLSESDIKRIPTMSYRKAKKSKSTDDKCAICLSAYKTNDTVKRLQCKHVFHPECIDPWLKTSTLCPICRSSQQHV